MKRRQAKVLSECIDMTEWDYTFKLRMVLDLFVEPLTHEAKIGMPIVRLMDVPTMFGFSVDAVAELTDLLDAHECLKEESSHTAIKFFSRYARFVSRYKSSLNFIELNLQNRKLVRFFEQQKKVMRYLYMLHNSLVLFMETFDAMHPSSEEHHEMEVFLKRIEVFGAMILKLVYPFRHQPEVKDDKNQNPAKKYSAQEESEVQKGLRARLLDAFRDVKRFCIERSQSISSSEFDENYFQRTPDEENRDSNQARAFAASAGQAKEKFQSAVDKIRAGVRLAKIAGSVNYIL